MRFFSHIPLPQHFRYLNFNTEIIGGWGEEGISYLVDTPPLFTYCIPLRITHPFVRNAGLDISAGLRQRHLGSGHFRIQIPVVVAVVAGSHIRSSFELLHFVFGSGRSENGSSAAIRRIRLHHIDARTRSHLRLRLLRAHLDLILRRRSVAGQLLLLGNIDQADVLIRPEAVHQVRILLGVLIRVDAGRTLPRRFTTRAERIPS